MFAIGFDLVVADTLSNHPKGVARAYTDIGNTLAQVRLRQGAGRPLHHPER